MAFFQNAYYTCNCEKEKCDRNCLEFRKMTHTESNGDMIRNMTDEELASFMYETDWNGGCPKGMFFTEASCLSSSCYECWENWLKQEVQQ